MSERCINCGGYQDERIDPEGCVCKGDERAPWQVERDEASRGRIDLVDRLIRWDEGDLEYDEFIETAQYLVDTGMAWQLQGHIGRTCADLIEGGQVTSR